MVYSTVKKIEGIILLFTTFQKV